jgi:hypothetical protein
MRVSGLGKYARYGVRSPVVSLAIIGGVVGNAANQARSDFFANMNRAAGDDSADLSKRISDELSDMAYDVPKEASLGVLSAINSIPDMAEGMAGALNSIWHRWGWINADTYAARMSNYEISSRNRRRFFKLDTARAVEIMHEQDAWQRGFAEAIDTATKEAHQRAQANANALFDLIDRPPAEVKSLFVRDLRQPMIDKAKAEYEREKGPIPTYDELDPDKVNP